MGFDLKICPRCYSKVPDDKQNCPQCGFKMVKIEPPAAAPRTSREEVKKPSPPKKKKAKKSDMIILGALVGAFILLMVLVSVPMPSLPSPPKIGGGSVKSAGAVQNGGAGSAQSSGGGAKQTPKPVATSGMSGAPYTVDNEDTVYFSLRKENIEALLAKKDVQQLIDEKELLVLENGTPVTLISVSGKIAFVDIMGGEYEGGVGYVANGVLKPVSE